jgi:hypothetical protein
MATENDKFFLSQQQRQMVQTHQHFLETDFYRHLRALSTLRMETKLVSETLMPVNYLTQAPMHEDFTEERSLTLSNPIFLPTAYSPALICFGW